MKRLIFIYIVLVETIKLPGEKIVSPSTIKENSKVIDSKKMAEWRVIFPTKKWLNRNPSFLASWI